MAHALEDVSYIRARDPSIQHFNRTNLKKARLNLQQQLSEFSVPNSIVQQSDREQTIEAEVTKHYIEVYLRTKPTETECDNYIIQGDNLLCVIPEQHSASKSTTDKGTILKKYRFTDIFGPESEQSEIFDCVVKLRLLEFINGENSSLLTYGASGAGKTFTIVGNAQEPGLVPRALEYLFCTLPQLPNRPLVKPMPSGDVIRLTREEQLTEMEILRNILNAQKEARKIETIRTYKAMQKRLSKEPTATLEASENISLGVWLSYAEIYNEEIYDLLQLNKNPPQRLRIGTMDNKIFIRDLAQVHVSSGIEAYQVFHFGMQRLKYTKTNVNSHSSRSHFIFTITLAQALNNTEQVQVSTFNFCDLAGVERTKKTMQIGNRSKESKSINNSLLVLGKCMEALRENQKCPNTNSLIPFRESKLTQIFQKVFTSHENLTMIVNINTSPKMFDETQNVLNFSAIDKEVFSSQPGTGKMNQVLSYKNADCLEEEKKQLEQALSDAENVYITLRSNRRHNFETEEKYLINGWEELLKDDDLYECQRGAIIKKHERELQYKLFKMKRKISVEMDNCKTDEASNKKKLKENMRQDLQNAQRIINELETEMEDVKNTYINFEKKLFNIINSNDDKISMLEKEKDNRELDSFIRHEISCGPNHVTET